MIAQPAQQKVACVHAVPYVNSGECTFKICRAVLNASTCVVHAAHVTRASDTSGLVVESRREGPGRQVMP